MCEFTIKLLPNIYRNTAQLLFLNIFYFKILYQNKLAQKKKVMWVWAKARIFWALLCRSLVANITFTAQYCDPK